MFMGVKKQELPAWHTQVLQGGGLEFATANNGACHTKGGVFNNEVWGIPFKVDPFSTEGKAGLCVDAQHHAAARDTTGICSLLSLAKIDDTVPPLLAAATGVDYTLEDTYIIGERIWNLERLFNVKAGFTSKDDILPKRIMEQPMSEGPGVGQVNRLYEMLPEYYRLRGWDEDGIPTPEKLVELDLP